jgi:cellulase/cellobiase CelA1
MITNTTSSPLAWEVHYTPGGRIDAMWNVGVAADPQQDGRLVLTGEAWNDRLGAQRWTTFGMCVGY